MFDIVVSGGTAVLPSGPEPADIGVTGDKIVAIGAPGNLAGIPGSNPGTAGRTVDASGQIVIAGRHRSACPLQLADADARCRPAYADRAGLASSLKLRKTALEPLPPASISSS